MRDSISTARKVVHTLELHASSGLEEKGHGILGKTLKQHMRYYLTATPPACIKSTMCLSGGIVCQCDEERPYRSSSQALPRQQAVADGSLQGKIWQPLRALRETALRIARSSPAPRRAKRRRNTCQLRANIRQLHSLACCCRADRADPRDLSRQRTIYTRTRCSGVCAATTKVAPVAGARAG